MKNILLTILTILLPVANLLAQVTPPPPEYGEDASGGPGSPSNVPIDDYAIVLIGVAFLLSAYFVYRNRQVAKA